MGQDMQYIMGPAKILGGAVASYFGGPEVGVPLMVSGVAETAGGSGSSSGSSNPLSGFMATPDMLNVAKQNPSLAKTNLSGSSVAGVMPGAPNTSRIAQMAAPQAGGGSGWGMLGAMSPMVMQAMGMGAQQQPQPAPPQPMQRPILPPPQPGMGMPQPLPPIVSRQRSQLPPELAQVLGLG